MSDEQREILQMVSDGKITAEDGVKLLEALSRGREKTRESESPASRVRRRKRLMFNRQTFEPHNDIGHMVMSVVHDAMSGIKHDLDEPEIDINEFGDADSFSLDGDLELDEGTELILQRDGRNRRRSGSVMLIGVEGSTCRVVSGAESGVMVDREDNAVRLRWDDGDLVLEVPAVVARVTAEIMGGDLVTQGIGASVRLRSKGGDIILLDTGNSFDAKTMGGDLMITLTEGWSGDSRISTMGGDITLGVQAGTPGLVTARTLGGCINVSDDLGETSISDRPGSTRVRLELGEGSDRPSIRMKTMGGDITIGLAEELAEVAREAAEAVREASETAREEVMKAAEELAETRREIEEAREEFERVRNELETDVASFEKEDGTDE